MSVPHVYISSFDTAWGVMCAAAGETGLLALTLPGEEAAHLHSFLDRVAPQHVKVEGAPILDETRREIEAYFKGEQRNFTVPLDLRGTAFQKLTLAEVARIPYGETRTYGDIARAVGKPGGMRAVGMANAHNPLPIVIPCHRVVASDGLGGYAGGLEMKRRLLALENARSHDKPDLFDADYHEGER